LILTREPNEDDFNDDRYGHLRFRDLSSTTNSSFPHGTPAPVIMASLFAATPRQVLFYYAAANARTL
jgi:hypothetical protein